MSILSLFGIGAKSVVSAAKLTSKVPSAVQQTTKTSSKAIEFFTKGVRAPARAKIPAQGAKPLPQIGGGASARKYLSALRRTRPANSKTLHPLPAALVTGARTAAKSGAVKAAVKIGIVGGALGIGGILAGFGVNEAIVKPFKNLGLVTTDENGKTVLTATGKTVLVGLVVAIVGGIVIFGISRVKK